MSVKSKVILTILSLLAAYGFGRWSAPEKVRVETKIVEVEKIIKDTKTDVNRDKHKQTTVVEVTKPDGTKETTTTTIEDTKTDKTTEGSSVTEKKVDSETVKEITRASAKVTLSALYGAPVTGGKPVYGGVITKPFLGPLSAGAFLLTPSTLGLSLGLTF